MGIGTHTKGKNTDNGPPSSAPSVGEDVNMLVVEHGEESKMDNKENEMEHLPEHRITWEIKDFTKRPTQHFSDVFYVEGYKWRLLIYPKGNDAYHLCIYLYAADLPDDRKRFVQFSITVINQKNNELSRKQESQHKFNTRERDWGFNFFMPLSELYDSSRGYLIDDTVIVEVGMRSIKDVPCNPEKEANYVGSKNQVDPMTSILQENSADSEVSDGFNDYYSFGSSMKDSGSDGSRNQRNDEIMNVFLRASTYYSDSDRVNKKNNYDSKKETCYVGLKNQGATCYINSLLQSLYHIPFFRKVVYNMSISRNDLPSESIPLALRRLFFKLQNDDASVSTEDLTKSLGLSRDDSFVQCDVQEFNRILFEKLEDKMEGAIQQLFEGHHINYIECTNITYKSTRKESFCDIQLDVKGCKDIYASLDKYVEVENLHGDNKYDAEEYGLQDAKKGVLFLDFPPVLQLHLKRFEYDPTQDRTAKKVNDHYEFPLQLDLDRDNGRYLSSVADRRIRNLYTLHSVLVHSGEVQHGHYYAFIRPTLCDQWYMFNDEVVTKVDMKRALDEQYGGEQKANLDKNGTPSSSVETSNAYMLVYIRESDKDEILCDIDDHITERLRNDQDLKGG